MSNIVITLLTSKRTRCVVDELAAVVAAQSGGYVVVAGEANSTQITVNYPEAYASATCYVYMKNSRGEYEVQTLTGTTTQKTFTLPGSMTYRGNTILVFHAQDGDSTTVWTPVIVPVAETGVDYTKVTTVSDDTLQEILQTTAEAVATCKAVQEKAECGEFNGDSVFIRYSANADGSGMTEEWTSGQRYIGLYVGSAAPTDYAEYSWHCFVGDSFCKDDAASTEVSYTLEDNTDYTFSADGITKVSLTVPAGIKHGFSCGLNIKTGDSVVVVEAITNNSSYSIKYMELGHEVSRVQKLPANCTAALLFYCDGVNLNCYISGASD